MTIELCGIFMRSGGDRERILVYYCGADTVIGVAEIDKKHIRFDQV